MKTLQKITLMAFAVLSAGAANAQTQCNNCTPPTVSQPPTVDRPICPSCNTIGPNSPTQPRLTTFNAQPLPEVTHINSSSVYQSGTNQFACINQIDDDNVAGLVQSPTAAGGGRNDAYQSQKNTFSSVDNRMYGNQSGSDNLLVQGQNGGGNYARADQSGSHNVGVQNQGDNTLLSTSNAAILSQSNDYNASIQYQRGSNNTSDVAQYAGSGNWSATTQFGTHNAVIVNQH